MKKIILHWTAGNYFPTDFDKRFYHYLIDKNGNIHEGKFKPENNLRCVNNNYAKHTGGGNTGAIGVAMCGMFGFECRTKIGNYPISPKQLEATFKFCAELCQKYKINITPETVMTHYEFGLKNPQTTSAGKIDIIFLPPYSWVAQKDIGSFIRAKIKWYKGRI